MPSMRGPDNSVRVAISGTNYGSNWANIFHCQLTTSSAIAQADLDTWTTAFQAAYKTRFGARQANTVTYGLAKCICFTPGGTELISSISMTGNGALSTGLILDASCSGVVSWNTNVYWRGGKPRTYLNGMTSNDVSTGTILSATGITNLTTAGNNFRSDVQALTAGTITGTTFGFVSFFTGNTTRPTPLFFPISSARVHARLGTQRRRLGKWLN